MEIKEESVDEELPEKPTSPLPPPPPQFANETTLAEQQQRSRKSSKESMKSIKEEEETHKVQSEENVRPSVHQDVRRTVSADDKTISSALSTTITINQLQDPSNSLASSNGNQVTIVTSHPPVIIDNTPQESPSGNRRLSKSLSYDNNTKISSTTSQSEVIIISNDTNKTRHLHESSTDDDYQSYDSLESSPKFNNSTQINNGVIVSSSSKVRPRKLDESEVLIVSPEGIFEEDLVDDSPVRHNQMDTSHVSVVTVGDDQGGVKVKDSSGHLLIDSNSDLSNVSDGIDNFQQHPRIANGQVIYNSKRSSSSREDDVNLIVQQPNKIKQRISPDSSVDCSSSTTGSPTRAISENGSMRSDSQKHAGIAIRTNSNNNMKNHVNHHNDRSDAESISTTTSHDSSRDDNLLDGVQLRRKDTTPPETPPATITAKSPTPKTQRTKEEIQLANLKKKTRKRTRKFEIDGVQVTTTTSKVIYGDDENGRLYDDHIFRKQELRELKLLQKMEKKQFYELQAKEQIAKDQQDKKFEQERMALERTYEADMDVLARQHKQTIEKYEQQQENELRNTSKKIRIEQERELKLVRFIFFEIKTIV